MAGAHDGSGAQPPERPDTAPAPNPRGRMRAVLVATALAAAGAIVWALVANWRKIADYEWHLEPLWLAGGIVAVMASYQVNGLTYARSVEMVSSTAPPRPVGVSIWARSLLARYIPGSVMMLVGRALMASQWGVAKRTTVAATIYEQLIGLGLGAAASVAYVGLYGNPGNPYLMLLLAVIPVGLVFLHPRLFGPMSTRVLRRLRREPLPQLYTGRQIGALAAGYSTGALLVCLGVWMLLRSAAGPEVGGPLEISLAFLLAFAVSTMAIIFPSGLGVRDGLLAVLIARNLGDDALAPALALSVGLRFALVILELVYVGLAVAVGRRR